MNRLTTTAALMVLALAAPGCTRNRNLPTIRQPREPEPSTINEKTLADFTRVVEQTGILEREPATQRT